MNKRLIVVISIFFLLYVVFVSFLIFRPKLEKKEVAQKETTSPIKKPSEIDVLAFSGWSGRINRLSDNSIQFANPPGSTEVRIKNPNDPITVGHNGFEVDVEMRTVTQPDSQKAARGLIMLFNEDPRLPDTKWLEIGLNNFGYLNFIFADLYNKNPEKRRIALIEPSEGAKIVKFNSNKLKIQYVRQKEKWNILDGSTGAVLVENIKLPINFFESKESNLYFGLYVISGSTSQIATMTVSEFKVKSK